MSVVALAPFRAPAFENPELTAYFNRKIGLMRESLAKMETSPADPSMELKTVNIEIAPAVSFGISSVVSLTVAPELDFVLVPETMESK